MADTGSGIQSIAGIAVPGDIDPAILAAAVEAAVRAALAAQGKASPAEEPRKVTFAELWASYRLWGEVHIPSWPTNQRSHEKKILPFWGGLTWDQCTPEKEAEFRARLREHITKRKKPTTPGYRNRVMVSVKSCLEWHAKRRPASIPFNPLRGTREERAPKTRDFYVPDEEFLVLMRSASPVLRLMLVVLFETGCRRDEIRLLEESEIDFGAKVIRLSEERTKGDKQRDVPLSDVAIEALRMALAMRGPVQTPYVFPNPKGTGGPIPASTLYGWFVSARTRAGIRGPKGQDVWMHTLRHSWASLQASSGMPMMKLMAAGGWSDPEVAARYQNMSPEIREQTRKHMNERRPAHKVAELTEALRADPDVIPIGRAKK